MSLLLWYKMVGGQMQKFSKTRNLVCLSAACLSACLPARPPACLPAFLPNHSHKAGGQTKQHMATGIFLFLMLYLMLDGLILFRKSNFHYVKCLWVIFKDRWRIILGPIPT